MVSCSGRVAFRPSRHRPTEWQSTLALRLDREDCKAQMNLADPGASVARTKSSSYYLFGATFLAPWKHGPAPVRRAGALPKNVAFPCAGTTPTRPGKGIRNPKNTEVST
jgi:hypothetical protein